MTTRDEQHLQDLRTAVSEAEEGNSTQLKVVILRKPALRQRLGGVSNSTIHRLTKAKRIPAPFRMGGSACWLEHEVDAAIMKLRDQALEVDTSPTPTPQQRG
jgi:predicted DNA-binding transcriptional regulator AlpA